MSAYYDLFDTPDPKKTGKKLPLHARMVPKGTMDRNEFMDRVHLFTGISRSVLEGAMQAFSDELCDSLANGWTVEFGELGYFTPSLQCRPVMDKKEIRSSSVFLRGLNFRLSKGFFRKLAGKMTLSRVPADSSSSVEVRSADECLQLLLDYLAKYPCINRAQYCRLTGRKRLQGVNDLNLYVEQGVLMRHGMGKAIVYAKKI